eukprot:gnl/TRDRNA2_/TRDRNA2_166667_c2_seq1.p1 gnl/TRDRNA2_/TRDRNA2_166667_c2~~gnl/TRDRNA2_/TRDRNA2_166667_c2_seq1.p1  ORF type:complete len:618 (+),score=186.22 gnl/TRDRNA2_/TRDRNA2_166667_c2_seq1:1-1854(+)
MRQLHEQESAAARGQVEQARFALSEKDRQLQEKVEALVQKEEETKSLLRQLANTSNLQEEAAATAKPEAETSAVTTFEVMFALEGSLGLEFEKLAAPYVVAQVHENKVATGLGILQGDELIAVADKPVTESPWNELVQFLQPRPVVARFSRDPAKLAARTAAQEGGGLISSVTGSVSSVGGSLLSAAKSVVPGKPGSGGDGEADARLKAEVERLGTLLKARDHEIEGLNGKVKQQDEALRLLESSEPGRADVSQLAQERESLSQQLLQLQERHTAAEKLAEQLQTERDLAGSRWAEEVQQKEEYRQQAHGLNERCNSLMLQFESLRTTCQNLSLDAQQKAAMEKQVQELTQVNAQWQQAHQNATQETDNLKQQANEMQHLLSEVAQLRTYQHACQRLEERLNEAEATIARSADEMMRLQEAHMADQNTIQRLQMAMENEQESGETFSGHLEGELLERSRECLTLRRELDEQRRRADEPLQRRESWQEAMEESSRLKSENADLKSGLETAQKEKEQLNGIVERCVEKLEKESRERPHLVDKRMVTQMLAAYLEQRDNPRQAEEIMNKMADLLGFMSAEREQVGLSHKRRGLSDQQEAAGLDDLADHFVDFLFEESEGA